MTYGKTKGTVVDVTGLSQIRISAGYSGAYYKFLTDEETAQNINLLGGASQTVTATYTGDETYVKPTVETVLDGFGNKVSETYYKHGTDTVLNKNTYKYELCRECDGDSWRTNLYGEFGKLYKQS